MNFQIQFRLNLYLNLQPLISLIKGNVLYFDLKLLWRLYTGYTQRMVRFQKSTRNLFLTLHGHNVHSQQRQMSKLLMRYQQFASHAYCGAAGPVSKMAS